MFKNLVSNVGSKLASNIATCTQLRVLPLPFEYVVRGEPHHFNRCLSSLCNLRLHNSAFYSTESTEELSTPSTQSEEPDVLYKNINVEVMGHDPTVLNSYEFFATEAAKLLDIPCQSETPPKVIDRRTLLKSRHVHGKYHKVQYEARTHFKLIKLSRLTGSTADTYLEYIQRNLPEGMAMKVTKTRIEPFPEHIKRPEE